MKSYRKEAASSASTKLAKLSGSHGTESNPGGNKLATMESPPRGSNIDPVIRGSKVATFARGGRTKSGKTNVNIIIGKPGGDAPAAAMPPPVAAMPPGGSGAPPPPPSSGPTPGGPPMPAGLAPGAGVGMPPGMPGAPPLQMPRKHGGRTVIKKADGGALVRSKLNPAVLEALAGERAQMLPNGGEPPAIDPAVAQAALAQQKARAGTMGLLRKYGGRTPAKVIKKDVGGALTNMALARQQQMANPTPVMSGVTRPIPAGFSPAPAAIAPGLDKPIAAPGGTMGLLRKYGGRAMTAGAVSGEGRLEKAANIRGKLNKRSGS